MVMYQTSKAALAKDFDLDNSQETLFADFYRKMPKRVPGTLRLFDRKDYYSAHGEDALYVADNVYHTKTVLKYFRSKSGQSSTDGLLASCTLSKAVATSFLRDALASKQLRIEIWAQPASAASTSKGGVKWELERAASPGNLEDVEDLLFQNQDILETPMCMALTFRIKDGIKHVGVAYVDSVDRKLGVSEFVETDIFSNTESLFIQLGVKEVIFPTEDKGNETEGAKLRKLIDRCGVVSSEQPKSKFSVKSVDQDLNNLLKGEQDIAQLPVFDDKLGMSACAALISYLDLLSSDAHRGSFSLHTHDLSHFMKLDASAIRALTLMPDSSTPGAMAAGSSGAGASLSGRAGKDSSASLFGLLNKCRTSQGTRLLATWLKQPLVNLHQIENRQKLVDAFFEDPTLRNGLRDDVLKLLPDTQRLAKRFLSGRAGLDDVVTVYQATGRLPRMLDMLMQIGRRKEKAKGKETYVVEDEALVALMDETYVTQLSDDIENLSKFVDLVETTIDVQQLDNHKVVIKPDFDDLLKTIAGKLQESKDALDNMQEEVASDLGMEATGKKKSPLNFENHQVFGHCFRLTRKEAGAIKGKKGYIELANRTNGCYFTTRKLKEINAERADLMKQYEKKQSTLAKEVVSIAGSYAPTLEVLNGLIAHLDVITSFAHVAYNAPIAYVKPTMLNKGEGDLILKESRHPCLETMADINFIPNDVEMKRDASEFQIITGANTGGKSVYLRQIGCIALMAQVGSFVPAEEAQIPIFDCILARVGAGDSQLKGISTFMAEMLETATILKSATKDSLIIIDELGRGTSTYDGFGLAWAISEHIAKEIRCFALFATHFHDLTSLSEDVPHVKNLHVMAHVEEKSDSITGRDIVMLYKVMEGISDQSFGIHVAELAKFPDEVVRLAKRKADELEETFEDGEAASDEAASTSKRSKHTAEEISEGTALAAEMLKAWKQRTEEELSDLPPPGTQDSITADGEVEGSANTAVEARLKQEMEILKSCFEEYRPKLEQSAWASSALLDTY